jgi:hypothetical protein
MFSFSLQNHGTTDGRGQTRIVNSSFSRVFARWNICLAVQRLQTTHFHFTLHCKFMEGNLVNSSTFRDSEFCWFAALQQSVPCKLLLASLVDHRSRNQTSSQKFWIARGFSAPSQTMALFQTYQITVSLMH